jgi:cyclomaltodextrinase
VFARFVHKIWHSYPEDGDYGSYTLLSSHDKPRFLTACDGDARRLALALAFQFAFPGAPAIYCGDEVGLQGGEDPDNRRCFPWDESVWNAELVDQVRSLTALRKREQALRRGSYELLSAVGRGLSYERRLGEEAFRIAVTASRTDPFTLQPPDGTWLDVFSGREERGDLPIPPLSFKIIRRS